jgi:EAL domain-containing protein (putative c-di-GMP-specific phosphodiesterase class I)
MTVDENDAVIVRSTIGLAHDQGLSVVAEGVEDHRTCGLLAELGCDLIQGYAVSKPLAADDLAAWVSTGGNARVGSQLAA